MSVELLKEYIADTGLSQKSVGAQIGVSPTVVNQYLKGGYPGDVERIDDAVEQLIKRYKEKLTDVPTDFIATPTAKRILETCALAHAMSDIDIVIGEAGLGKTQALKHYAKTNENVVMIDVDPTFSAKVLLAEICMALGLTTARNNHAMMTAIVDKLKGSNRLLIIDEAELLTNKPLENLRRIHDKTGVGIVLAGMPQLRANLYGSRGQYKQLYSRIALALDLKSRLPKSDIAMFSEAALGTSEFNEYLYKVSGGNARRLNKLLRGVKRLSAVNKAPVSIEMIDRYSEMLVG